MSGTGEQTLGYDDSEFAEPAFRGDGQILVGAEDGGDPGIWIYPRNGTDPSRIVSVAWDSDNRPFGASPTFVGGDRLAFIHGQTIRTVGTSCSSCGLGQTTSLGSRPGIDNVAWTSQHVPDPVRQATPAPAPAAPAPTPVAPRTPSRPRADTKLATLKLPAKAKLASVLRSGLKVPFTASRKGKLTMQATVSGADAKKLRLVRRKTKKAIVVASGAVTVKRAGAATVTLKFTKAAKKRLKRARAVQVSLRGTFAGDTITGRVRLAR
jgi:hypothetical protein